MIDLAIVVFKLAAPFKLPDGRSVSFLAVAPDIAKIVLAELAQRPPTVYGPVALYQRARADSADSRRVWLLACSVNGNQLCLVAPDLNQTEADLAAKHCASIIEENVDSQRN